MRNFTAVLILACLASAANAKNTKQASGKPESRLITPIDKDLFQKQVPNPFEECDSVSVKAINLREKLPEHDDLIATCDAGCGRGGCPYQIFLFRDGRYQQAAEFFGFFELKSDRHQGLADISLRNSLGADIKSTELLKFNGNIYE